MSIHKVEGGYVIASGGVWLPGCYEDERTARYAFRLSDAELGRLCDVAVARGDGIVTWGEVARAAGDIRAATKAKHNAKNPPTPEGAGGHK